MTNELSWKLIDWLKINKDNVSGISMYAKCMYISERYDEVEAEIIAKKGVKNV